MANAVVRVWPERTRKGAAFAWLPSVRKGAGSVVYAVRLRRNHVQSLTTWNTSPSSRNASTNFPLSGPR